MLVVVAAAVTATAEVVVVVVVAAAVVVVVVAAAAAVVVVSRSSTFALTSNYERTPHAKMTPTFICHDQCFSIQTVPGLFTSIAIILSDVLLVSPSLDTLQQVG